MNDTPTGVRSRVEYLDSIRGLAAVLVILFHCWLRKQQEFGSADIASAGEALHSASAALLYIIAKIAQTGRAPVMIFFVLSGYVLAISLQVAPMTYGRFIVKRMIRIYPVFLLAILVGFIFYAARDVITPAYVVVEHILLFGTNEAIFLNTAIWSLVHEMRISLVFPFILYTVIRFRAKAVFAYGAVSLLCAFGVYYLTGIVFTGTNDATVGLSLAASVYFIVFFAAGACAACERERIAGWVGKLPVLAKAGLLTLALAALLKSSAPENLSHFLIYYLYGVSALLIICLPLGWKGLANLLSHRLLAFIGWLSYSLYLMHVIVVETMLKYTSAGHWPLPLLFLCVISLSLPLAYLTARYVEYPAIRWGKRLLARHASRISGQSQATKP